MHKFKCNFSKDNMCTALENFLKHFWYVGCSQVIDTACIRKDPLWLDDHPNAVIPSTQTNGYLAQQFPIIHCCIWGVQPRGSKDVRHSIQSWEISRTFARIFVVHPHNLFRDKRIHNCDSVCVCFLTPTGFHAF